MKKSLTFFCMVLFSLSGYAQFASLTLSEYIPESASVTDVTIMNPNFKSSFLFMKSSGATVFKQTKEIFLVDSRTFQEKKKIPFPSYDGYRIIRPGTHDYMMYLSDAAIHDNDRGIELDQNLVYLHSSKANKRYAVSFVALNESLTTPEKPSHLFFIADESDRIFHSVNQARNIVVLSNEKDDKKLKTRTFYYRVYDNSMKLLRADSITSGLKEPDTLQALAYDNGFVLVKNNGKKRTVTVHDTRSNTTKQFDLQNGNSNLSIHKIRAIANDKIVFLGSYFSNVSKKKVNSGIFKVVFNQKTSTLEDRVFFDHVPAGKQENEDEPKYLAQAVISETGACYALVNQITFYLVNKFELMYINSATDKWRKQLPISNAVTTASRSELVPNTSVAMTLLNGNVVVAYRDYEDETAKFDFNNYIYGEPTPSMPKSLKDSFRANISLLKINQAGNIQHQKFPGVYYSGINNVEKGFVAINQTIEGMTYSKCKFVAVALND